MPIVTEHQLKGYAWCSNPLCHDQKQVEVGLLKRETQLTYRDSGGDSAGTEKSFVTFGIEKDEDASCQCGRPRVMSVQPRRQIAPLSGHDPNYIARNGSDYDPSRPVLIPGSGPNPEVEALKARIAQLEAKE